VTQPNALFFRLNLSITGTSAVVAMYTGEPVEIRHNVEEVETGVRKTLGPFAFTTPATVAGLAAFEFTTGPFTTSLSTGTGEFRTAPGDDDGVYRVVTEFHFTSSSAAVSNSVFDDRILAINAG
jgi:hypothetical protein